jgi:hypothetical protein
MESPEKLSGRHLAPKDPELAPGQIEPVTSPPQPEQYVVQPVVANDQAAEKRAEGLRQQLGMEDSNEKLVKDKFKALGLQIKFTANTLRERGERKFSEFVSRDDAGRMIDIQGRMADRDYSQPESFVESAKDLRHLANIIDSFDRAKRVPRDSYDSLKRLSGDLKQLIEESDKLTHALTKNPLAEAQETHQASKKLGDVAHRQRKFIEQLAGIVGGRR